MDYSKYTDLTKEIRRLRKELVAERRKSEQLERLVDMLNQPTISKNKRYE